MYFTKVQISELIRKSADKENGLQDTHIQYSDRERGGMECKL